MVEAVVFINIEPGGEEGVVEALNNMPEVKEACLVYGPYDVIAKVSADTLENLEKVVVEKIRKIPKIRNTTTLVISRSIK